MVLNFNWFFKWLIMEVKIAKYDKQKGWVNYLPKSLDSKKTLIIVFGANSYFYEFTPIQKLINDFSKSKIIGCSTAGEIIGQTITDESLSVAAISFEKTDMRIATSPVVNSEDSFKAGEDIANALNEPKLRGVIVLSDGLNVNGSELVAGLNANLPSAVVVTGGLAADGDRFEQTWVLKDGVPKSNFVSAVGFYGDSIKIGHGSKGGWDIFGPEREVTKSMGNQLFEVDGKPALELYKLYLGDRASDLPASALLFPLSMRSSKDEDKRIVRTILGIDEENQSMTFAGDIPEGSLVQLMRANLDRLIDGAYEAAVMTKLNNNDSENVFSISISCVGRRLILGERAEEELEAAIECLPQNTKQIGFYSYGEISPYAKGNCDLHNQTMTLTTISEG